jgi:outer membrane protein assembly factor BamA
VRKAGKYLFLLFFSISLLGAFSGCSSTRKLRENEYLLSANIIRTNTRSLNNDEMLTHIRQKPNRKLFLVYPFYLQIYNLINQDKLRSQKQKRDDRIDRINARRRDKNTAENEKRKAKGKPEKPLHLKSKDRLTFREWLVNIGEEPSIYDSMITKRSVKQLSLYLDNKGYFNNTVKDSAVRNGKKVKIFYLVKTPRPYTIRKINYEVDDSIVGRYVLADSSNSLISSGQNYDIDVLQKERDRITKMLKNQGYFYFSKEYIYFSADTNLRSYQMDLTIGIKKQTILLPGSKDSTIEVNHKQYHINTIYVITDNLDRSDAVVTRDTIKTADFNFLYAGGKIQYKTSILSDAIYLHKGDLYQDQEYEDTYKRLAQLKAFRKVSIELLPSPGTDGMLDCIIKLSPVYKQAMALSFDGTNTGGNLGVDGILVYQNKNMFKGAEILEIKAKGALEVQTLVTNIGAQQKTFLPFNTFELGPEFNLHVPRPLFPFNLFSIGKSASPQTSFISYYNFQHRPDYTRSILNIGYSYDWREGRFKKYSIFPLEVNLVKLPQIDPAFQAYLNQRNDLYLKSRFQDHITTDTRFSYTYTNQEIKKKTDYIFLRLDLESSGTLMRSLFELSNSTGFLTIPKDAEGSYRIQGIKFSQYVKGGFDFRYYKYQSEHNRIVFRIASGLGVPFHNLSQLPFEKSFFAGGPNSVRAFQARSLGPGSYNHSGPTLYQLGDMNMEGNIEYRFKIFKMLNSAVFIDAGNIWLLHPDPNRPNGEFDVNRFYNEFAIGAGLGLRLDFDFFIIRLDAGVPLRDPSRKVNDRWTFNTDALKRTNLNFGIGYPF